MEQMKEGLIMINQKSRLLVLPVQAPAAFGRQFKIKNI
jgi:hypothetical protein